jgi:hypothetical protein
MNAAPGYAVLVSWILSLAFVSPRVLFCLLSFLREVNQ